MPTHPHADNPITRRLDRMAEMWEAFEERGSARVGRWFVKHSAYKMVEAFVHREQGEAGVASSVILKHKSPFQDSSTYGADLCHELIQTLNSEENASYFHEQEIPISSILQKLQKADSDSWLSAMAELKRVLPDVAGCVVAYLIPSQVAHAEEWADWIKRAVRKEFIPEVRLMVADVEEAPVFSHVADLYPELIETLDPELDMREAILEIASDPGKNAPNDPGFLYRKEFISLTQAMNPGSETQARKHAEEAAHIAKEQGWHDLHTAAFLALGAAMMNHQLFEDAIEAYERALQAAVAIEDQALRARLSLQAWMGRGGVGIRQKDYAGSASSYEKAALEGEKAPDPLMAMEAWRMAAFCHEHQKDYLSAWEALIQALNAAEDIPSATRPNTTLPYVGMALSRSAAKLSYLREAIPLRERLDAWLGKDWEQKHKASQPA
jgi:tetratricopeptide (TPR) repeat protein